jgi:hypothetical protein
VNNKLCEANSEPSKHHLKAQKHLLRYLKGTTNLGIILGGHYDPRDMGLYAVSNAAHGDVLGTRYSTDGHVIYLADAPIFWKSKKMPLMLISSTKAEFCNLTPTGKSLDWVAEILKNLGCEQPTPLVIMTDSANARHIVLNPLRNARTRNINIRYKWIIDEQRKGVFTINHIAGKDTIADELTKPLEKNKHQRFIRQLRLCIKPW